MVVPKEAVERITKLLEGKEFSCAVVDRDSQYGILISQILSAFGLKAQGFTGKKMLDELKERTFDCVLLSFDVPEREELIEVIGKKNNRIALVVVLDVSSSVSVSITPGNAVMKGFLMKPFDTSSLIEIIERAVER